MEKFVEFWGDIWEKEKEKAIQPWINEIDFEFKSKVYPVEKFDVTEDNLASVLKKRKNWSACRIDGIQNYLRKKFKRI